MHNTVNSCLTLLCILLRSTLQLFRCPFQLLQHLQSVYIMLRKLPLLQLLPLRVQVALYLKDVLIRDHCQPFPLLLLQSRCNAHFVLPHAYPLRLTFTSFCG